MQNYQKPSQVLALIRRTQRKTPQMANAERIVERISRAITERKLSPGTKLVEETLGDIFGVSRTKVREALLQLAKEKLVTLQPARGAFVAQPSVREAREIFEARRVLEHGIASKFTRVASREQLSDLRAHLAREREAVAAPNVRVSAKLSGEFHLLIAEMAGNLVLAEILRELVSRTSLIIVLYETSLPASCSCEDHDALLARMELQDPEGAAKVMVEHLERIEHTLSLREPVPPLADLRSALAGV